MTRAFRRQIPPSVIRGVVVAAVLVVILATFGVVVTHLGTSLFPHPVPTTQP